jgi:hypothetical protein
MAQPGKAMTGPASQQWIQERFQNDDLICISNKSSS